MNFRTLMFRAVLVLVTVMSFANITQAADDSEIITDDDIPRTYVGRAVCSGCHADVNEAYAGSHHDLAMQHVSESSVLGDFDNVTYKHLGETFNFYRNGDRFMVRTAGLDGEPEDFEISFTFGVYPLQQYLVKFPGGRLQALSVAFDTRARDAGGQRWFHLNPDDAVPPGDVLHWTGPNLNWNYMCADCHSTAYRKNYDAATQSYASSYAEIDVSCEACHGPASRHVEWANNDGDAIAEYGVDDDYSLAVRFNERTGVSWSSDPETGTVSRSTPRTSSREIDVCARCHSRRSQLTDQTDPGDPFMDGYRPSLLTEGLYHADGQIQDEVYVWGSFLQSKMYMAGVTCSDCHDPHTADLRRPGDATCLACHAGDRYATSAHHFHPQESLGARCVECHMPSKVYMQVDARHDHSIRIPRPDLSVTLGTPNACNNCHEDQDAKWAADTLKQWYGSTPRGLQGYARALTAGRSRASNGSRMLKSIVASSGQPVIARASALTYLGAYPDRDTFAMIQMNLNADDALMRLAAVDALAPLEPRARVLAIASLWDDLKAVRIAAARTLAGYSGEGLNSAQLERLNRGIEEYIEVQEFNAERPEAQLNLADLYFDSGRMAEADAAYMKALELGPQFVPGYVNYAQMLAQQDREMEAEAVLREGVEKVPGEAAIHHSLGLSLIRQQRLDDALEPLATAHQLEPQTIRFGYIYAVALNASGRVDDALKVLEPIHAMSPDNIDVLVALITFNRDAGRFKTALDHARKLKQLIPDDAGVDQLIVDLERAAS
ncbi:MAG: hypothetical protein DHS20C01_32610 [marine bacterium B5-7]|nr:MAG: hypothetical protein DHS20C01_32610 [marine bacterium B5-7]